MISLSTEDKSLESLRTKIYTVSSSPSLQVSYHYPFANDPQSVIKTWVLPLSKGYHVRIHKVTLSQEYRVSEGGFCVGTLNDNVRLEKGQITCGDTVSSIDVIASVPVKLGTKAIHPGMHNLKPLAYYPIWTTDSTLPAGEYVFISTVFFSTKEMPTEKPSIEHEGDRIRVSFGSFTQTINL